MSDKFTAQDYRQLSEALDAFDREFEFEGRPMTFEYPLAAAARRLLDRYQICQTCEDSEQPGKQGCDHDHHIPGDTTNGCRMFLDCPDCVGGLVPNQERLDEQKKTVVLQDVLDDLVQLSIVDADIAAMEVIDQPRHAGMRVGLAAALRYLDHNGLIRVVDKSEWPEWCESPAAVRAFDKEPT